ncbi:TetR/AcrR family transcriptional regulator [Promicromonospora citrea]|uniref:TetR family transcriptional regulator n=1 Tax=Promicromonospora citrea TaxID=43677 RepID=A0A8H9GG73_9MICO|nr:TetR/AcrR family transcriptional regulator [Promicromonospora citrea]NNH51412.1 TetR/AcrR family transcriptional regulator [Promicromonospora citrea]GGM23152.1 TetR family transcriptional regulator [Promicromonospora citrea]
MTPRRQQILDTAADLFAARGFHGVSMGDIGAAVGVSGPALYKHFAGKEDILGQCLLHASDQLLAGARELLSGAASPQAALHALVARHADFALDNPALIVIQEREWDVLGTEARAQVRKHQLAYIDVWTDALRPLRPDLDPAEARAAVQAAFGLLNSTPHSARINRATMHALLTGMAVRALHP